MKRTARWMMAATAASAFCLTSCAGPSSEVLPRAVWSGERPGETGGNLVEEVNPFYLQDALEFISSSPRFSGSDEETNTAEYMKQIFSEYGYEVELQRFSLPRGLGSMREKGTNVIAVSPGKEPDAKILVIAAHHDTVSGSPGANDNASGSVVLLEVARLLAGFSGGTELRLISFSDEASVRTGSEYYLDSLSENEIRRMIGMIQLDTLGYWKDSSVELGTANGLPNAVTDLISGSAMDTLKARWEVRKDWENAHAAFAQRQIPSVVVTQKARPYELGERSDDSSMVDVDRLAEAADVVVKAVADLVAGKVDVSEFRKTALFPYPCEKDEFLPFGWGHLSVEHYMGQAGQLIGSYEDEEDNRYETWQYQMTWFDVDQIILSDFLFKNDELELITLEAEAAGIEYEEMKERLCTQYGDPAAEEENGYGIQCVWEDPGGGNLFALIPDQQGYAFRLALLSSEEIYETCELWSGTAVTGAREKPIETLLLLTRDIFVGEEGEQVSEVRFFTDGRGNRMAELGEAEEEGKKALFLDVYELCLENGKLRDRESTVRLLLNQYSLLFFDKYGGLFLEKTAHDTEEESMRAEAFTNGLSRFILEERPETAMEREEQEVLYFYGFGHLIQIRNTIRENLGLEP